MEQLDQEQINGLLIGLGILAGFFAWAFISMSKWSFNRHYPREGDYPDEGNRVTSISYKEHQKRQSKK